MSENGGNTFLIQEISPNGEWFTTFEDNGETGYLYLGKILPNETENIIHDHLWIYNLIQPPIQECKEVFIIWSEDSLKTAIIVDNECWGMFDLKSWRKINAPREGNMITSLPLEVWEKGIEVNDGEQIKPI